MQNSFKLLVKNRLIILILIGPALFIAVSQYHISLWYLLLAGVLLGGVFGKVFCRWACPMGLIMELLTGMNTNGKIKQMYQYHKLGCPIAWISGLLNRISLFKIKLNADSCKNCGICDKQCYIVAMEPAKYSLYKPAREKPGMSYTCSKCLNCVTSCPNGSLQYKIKQ